MLHQAFKTIQEQRVFLTAKDAPENCRNSDSSEGKSMKQRISDSARAAEFSVFAA